MKKSIRFLHLILGLTAGIIVFIVAITGCLYAFQEEILDLTETYKFVEHEDKPVVPPSQLQDIAHAAFPAKSLHALKYYGNNRAAEAIYYNYEPNYYYIAYINPYSGKIIKTVDENSGFFRWVLDGHFYLWLPHELGQIVIASATIIFTVLIVTGIILWWPKTWRTSKQRFRFMWKKTTQWRRKNYDLHTVTGFYIFPIALVFSFTGLVWGFPWFAYGYYTLWGGEKSLIYEDPKVPTFEFQTVKTGMDIALKNLQQLYPDAYYYEVHPPENNNKAIAANANLKEGTYWKTNYHYYDPSTGKEKKVSHIYSTLDKASTADYVMRMNYDLHTGAILGLPGKITAFAFSLCIAALPVTGFIMYWGRKNKPTKNKTKPAH
ncbi:PepSY-associated TM helix domain-containing protein [Flavobacterium stagni]|nr:PepSY-associated TM helix domain-containing protein [Flavobacterium stagni]